MNTKLIENSKRYICTFIFPLEIFLVGVSVYLTEIMVGVLLDRSGVHTLLLPIFISLVLFLVLRLVFLLLNKKYVLPSLLYVEIA